MIEELIAAAAKLALSTAVDALETHPGLAKTLVDEVSYLLHVGQSPTPNLEAVRAMCAGLAASRSAIATTIMEAQKRKEKPP